MIKGNCLLVLNIFKEIYNVNIFMIKLYYNKKNKYKNKKELINFWKNR